MSWVLLALAGSSVAISAALTPTRSDAALTVSGNASQNAEAANIASMLFPILSAKFLSILYFLIELLESPMRIKVDIFVGVFSWIIVRP